MDSNPSPLPIQPRRKYTDRGVIKQVKNKTGGNNSKKGRGDMRGSFTHCPPGKGDGKSR